MIYFLVSPDGTTCKIGHTNDVRARYKQHRSSYTWKFHAAICGDRNHEQQIHAHFKRLRVEDAQEQYWLKDELLDYLEWLGTRAYAACDLNELAEAYEFPGRFPWAERPVRTNVQQTLEIVDQIVPGLRRPLARSARVLATIRSDSDEWYTPAIYIEAAREVMGDIDLDPASCALANCTVRAKDIFTATEDGLRYEWWGRVWLNPPYGNEKDRFVEHCLNEQRAGRVQEAIMCLNSHATDTIWFQQLWRYPICFTHHRVRFLGGQNGKHVDEGTPTTGTAFVYIGHNADRFAEVFSQFGPIIGLQRSAKLTAEEFRRLQKSGADWEVSVGA